MPSRPTHADTDLATLPNGVRVVAIRLPHLHTASVAVFVRSGSAHESRALSGVSHFVEHMAFKGTLERDARRINLDAERLGAEVNAHTDRDHTAYQMRGLAQHAGSFVRMLGDIVLNSTFPEAELERERQVLLQEFAEDEDDPVATAYKLFDRACYGLHPAALPVIGTRAQIQRLSRADLAGYVARQYSGANIVVGVAGPIDPEVIVREAEAAFGALPRGTANTVVAPVYGGDVRARRLAGSSQTHVVLGFPIAGLADEDPASSVAATVFGEGMSSPLLERVRERRALVYHASCTADRYDMCGQFVVEASTAPEHADEFLREVSALLAAHAGQVDPLDLERARNQLAVRRLRHAERALRRLEEAALDLFAQGRVRSAGETLDQLRAVSAEEVRSAFERMLAAGASAALVGSLGRGAGERARTILGALKA